MERFVKDWNKTEIPVEIKGMYIRHIADVDTIDQSFKIAIGYDMMWPATNEDINSWKANDVEFKPAFIPNFEFPNAQAPQAPASILGLNPSGVGACVSS